MLAEVVATRYVTPLREGGSLPGLMEADDLGVYVVKYVGAGQGRKALVAEIVAGQLARALGLPVPRLVTVDLDPALAANEPDEEVQDLLRASAGRNLGIDFLPGALDLDAGAFAVDADLAARVLWFDALVGNVDRSWRNPNLLFWHGRPYLIDHGASLTFHHRWSSAGAAAGRPYDASEHALIGAGGDVAAADAELASRVDADLLRSVVADVPDEWLRDEPGFASPAAVRTAYVDAVLARLAAREQWLGPLRDTAAAAPRRAARPSARSTTRPAWLR
ncbi:hypothetical protein SAMN05443575_0444 [Jatrophihabitans endophyticus]|uniref:HipA-like kinase domain-containing protein n=1 Tax=Jatrophihabitans endophyticus TaxID=1206085 RepID=A0A1M5D3M3_9ACTN|nr:HipA family kinase [Jatrophihabitans endophyticus]SHF61554.1 hypothetical protein SAMN05443575_0444 [Jatrophihabitans endophyticus]